MTNGLVVMTPSSIAYSGTSASINADGSVTFSAITSLSLNGVFTADYDSYMVAIRHTASSNNNLVLRFRTSGTDATAANYTVQELAANATTISGSRVTDANGFAVIASSNATQRCGASVYLFGPQLAQPTAFRAVPVNDFSSARILEKAGTHSLSTSYDGATFIAWGGPNQTGLLTVFGFNQ